MVDTQWHAVQILLQFDELKQIVAPVAWFVAIHSTYLSMQHLPGELVLNVGYGQGYSCDVSVARLNLCVLLTHFCSNTRLPGAVSHGVRLTGISWVPWVEMNHQGHDEQRWLLQRTSC